MRSATLLLALAIGTMNGPVPLASQDAPAIARLTPVFAIPAHAIAQIPGAVSVVKTADGDYLVLDRRAHALYRVARTSGTVRRLTAVGHEPGRLLNPSMISMSRDDIVAVMDAPNNLQRIQYFSSAGMLINGFFLPIQGSPSLIIGDQVVSGTGAMAFTGDTFYVNEPAWGSLVAELTSAGAVRRHIGHLRPTMQESDKELHAALNTGLPVVDPTGGLFFVFQAGRPMFRKYGVGGQLVYERHIEGVEIDGVIAGLPNLWPARPAGIRPVLRPTVRTAAADAHGRLWVALTTGYTYVYDTRGDKMRTVIFEGARPLLPSSLFFTRDSRVLVGPEGYEFDISGLGAPVQR
jgi:hypothetical protein